MSVPQDVAMGVATANVAVVTTAETVAVVSDPATCQYQHGRVFVLAWAQLTTGTDTTAVTARIRRGSDGTGTVESDEVAVTIGAAVGSNEEFMVMATDERTDETGFQYCLTLQQTGASANGTILQSGIVVIVV